MLLIILGAGASHDSVNTSQHPMDESLRPPLANGLFDRRFDGSVRQFEQLLCVLDRLRERPNGVSLEEQLETLQEEGVTYPKRLEQLVAIKFYLQNVLFNCGASWAHQAGQATNYVAMLDRIDHWRHLHDDQVAIVTFNYDLLI